MSIHHVLLEKTTLWLLHTWYWCPFENKEHQDEVKKELENRGYIFNKGDIVGYATKQPDTTEQGGQEQKKERGG